MSPLWILRSNSARRCLSQRHWEPLVRVHELAETVGDTDALARRCSAPQRFADELLCLVLILHSIPDLSVAGDPQADAVRFYLGTKGAKHNIRMISHGK